MTVAQWHGPSRGLGNFYGGPGIVTSRGQKIEPRVETAGAHPLRPAAGGAAAPALDGQGPSLMMMVTVRLGFDRASGPGQIGSHLETVLGILHACHMTMSGISFGSLSYPCHILVTTKLKKIYLSYTNPQKDMPNSKKIW